MLLIVIIGIIILLLLPYCCFKKPIIKQEYPHYDVLLVLGYPPNSDGTCSPILKARVDKALQLYQKGICHKIILSGGAVKNQYTEAQAMKSYALKQGIQEQDIFLEMASRNTYQNIKYSNSILEENHFDKVLIITSPWHIRKASHFAKLFHLDFSMIQSDYPEYFSFLHIVCAYLYSYLNMYYNLIFNLFK